MKKGLVLEGGGHRGIFTAGVLDVFLDVSLLNDFGSLFISIQRHRCSIFSKNMKPGFH